MKKLSILLALVLAVAVVGCACSSSPEASSTTEASQEASSDSSEESSNASSSDDKTIKVGASPTPHAEILAQIEQALADEGYTLEIVEFTDYIQPNVALAGGDLDANYFQHITYLNDYNENNGTDLVSAAGIHYEPFAIYSAKIKSLDELDDGAQIAVPNDPTNEARALLLLQSEGLIKLKDDAGLAATTIDIEENPKNLEIVEIEAAQLPRSLPDVDAAVINGNYALDAGLSAQDDAIVKESSDSDTAQAYTNVVAVAAGTEDSPKIQALIKALETDAVKQYMEDSYNGNVVAIF